MQLPKEYTSPKFERLKDQRRDVTRKPKRNSKKENNSRKTLRINNCDEHFQRTENTKQKKSRVKGTKMFPNRIDLPVSEPENLTNNVPFNQKPFLRSNCRDIMNLLHHEMAIDLGLKENWDRGSTHYKFSYDPAQTLTTCQPVPLPPISNIPTTNDETGHQDGELTPPTWTRISTEELTLSDEEFQVSENNDKWLRSSTPANTLPSILKK